MRERDGRHCDRCGVLLTRKNNRCGFELCDTCNDALELQVKEEKETKSEWKHDHEILKAYSDGANEVLDKIRAEISDFEEEVFNRPNTDYSDYAAVRHCLEIIDKYKAESEDKEWGDEQ